MVAFIIWCVVSAGFILLGIINFHAKGTVGFWSNIPTPEVEDIKQFNRAVGWMWVVFGILMMLLGVPLLTGQNSPYVLISGVGVVIEILAIMIIYTRIEKKYHKN